MIELMLSVGGMIAAIVVAYFSGKSSGKIEQQAETQKEVLDNVAKAKKASDAVASDSIDDVRQRLRDNARK